MSDPLLELDRVGVRFGRGDRAVTALEDVSLRLDAGASLALVGRSGAGKSTVARMALGLVRPTSGRIRFDGMDIGGLRRRGMRSVRRRVHLVFQDPTAALHPGMRVGHLVAEPLVIARVPRPERRDRVVAALEEVGLAPAERFLERYPSSLSGGQRQRVAFARALVGKPELVVADEPASMLDASLRAVVVELCARLRRDHGAALLFITHDLGLARYVGDELAVMAEGRVVERGETEAVLAAPEHPETARLIAAARQTTALASRPDGTP